MAEPTITLITPTIATLIGFMTVTAILKTFADGTMVSYIHLAS
jgi:hypothetical protein